MTYPHVTRRVTPRRKFDCFSPFLPLRQPSLHLGVLLLLWQCCNCLAFDAWSLKDPIDSGLRLTPTNEAALRNVLQTARRDANEMTAFKLMNYSIFRGQAAIRDLDEHDSHLLEPSKWLGIAKTDKSAREAAYRAVAAILLLQGHMDVAHEVLLGVTLENVDQAEYAATHPGETDWAEQHPLSDSADLLHAALHRLEGNVLGEGNHTGFENSKFWLAGGPKALETPACHAVRAQLARLALDNAPYCVEERVVADSTNGALHTIIAGGSATRKVRVPPGDWDGFAFVRTCKRRLCGELTPDQEHEVAALQRAELVLLLRHELEACIEDTAWTEES